MRELETKRLVLRTPKMADAEAMTVIRNSEFVQRYNAMRMIDAENLRRQIEKNIEAGTALYLFLKDENRLIGGVWLEDDDHRYEVNSKYLSFYLDAPYARQGYMKEALGAVMDMLFLVHPDLEVIASSTFSENIASQSLLTALGFVREGCIRRAVRTPRGEVHDDVQFSMLREEWQTKNI